MSINGASTTTHERRETLLPESPPSGAADMCGALRCRNLTIAVARTPSFFGEPTPRLLTYNPLKVPYLELTLPGSHKGWQTDRYLWLQSLSVCGAAIAIGFLTPEEAKHALEEQQDTLDRIATAIATLVAFLVAGFVSHVVGVWKERRTNYASLIGCMRSLLLGISSCVSLTPGMQSQAHAQDEELIQTSRSTMGRYVLLATELAILKPRGHIDSPRGMAHCERLGLLHEGEWAAMIDGDRHTSVLCWLQAMCVDLRRRGLLDGAELRVVCDAVTAARAQANDLMSSLNRDLPMPYTNLVGWLVRLAVVLQAMVQGLLIRGMDDTSCKVYASIGLLLYAFFFFSFLGMHRVLHNPFLKRLIDVGHEPIANEGLARLAEGLTRGVAFLPPRWPPSPQPPTASSAPLHSG